MPSSNRSGNQICVVRAGDSRFTINVKYVRPFDSEGGGADREAGSGEVSDGWSRTSQSAQGMPNSDRPPETRPQPPRVIRNLRKLA
eukprot:scaffold5109_cov44-Phaeocystis_antarctica.AAC.1